MFAQRRHKSICAFTESDQSLRCPHEERLRFIIFVTWYYVKLFVCVCVFVCVFFLGGLFCFLLFFFFFFFFFFLFCILLLLFLFIRHLPFLPRQPISICRSVVETELLLGAPIEKQIC